MLTLSRRQGESLYLSLSDDIDPRTPVGEVFASGPIVVRIARLKQNSVKVCVGAPEGVIVIREELVDV